MVEPDFARTTRASIASSRPPRASLTGIPWLLAGLESGSQTGAWGPYGGNATVTGRKLGAAGARSVLPTLPRPASVVTGTIGMAALRAVRATHRTSEVEIRELASACLRQLTHRAERFSDFGHFNLADGTEVAASPMPPRV